MAVKTTPEYIDLLNEAVEREIQVSIQYLLQHGKMEKLIRKVLPENILLDKTTYEAVGKFLREIGIQEMKHAASIMERIYYLGGEATTKAKRPVVGGSLSEFARLGVKAEEEALILYRRIIDEARKVGDYETHELFEKILGRRRSTSSSSRSTSRSATSHRRRRESPPSGARYSRTTTSPSSTRRWPARSWPSSSTRTSTRRRRCSACA